MKPTTQSLRSELRISVDDLRIGMFIAELDRPWSETPFLMQGFLLDDAAHLVTLLDFVAEVVIDPARSTAGALTHLPADALYAPLDATPPMPVKPATSVVTANVQLPTQPSTQNFSQFIARLYPREGGFSLQLPQALALWWDRLRVRRGQAGPRRAPTPRPARGRPDYLPANIPLLVYHDQSTMAEEATRARAVVQRAEAVLADIASDVRANLPIDIAGVQPIVDVLVDSVISNPAALIWSTRLHDESHKTYLHGLKVAIYMMALGRHLGFPREQLAELSSIGLLLDVGMLKIPASVLEKSDALTAEENALLIRHVDYSIEALEQKDPLPRFVARGILEHHERIDGSGYPQGLAGDAISIYGRMAAIADTFAAMTTARAYDVTHSAFDAMKELFREAEHKLHAPLVEQFVQAISIFPVGSLIELSTGEAAIVLEHNGVRRLEPKILVLTDPEKNLLAQPFSMDLMGADADRRKILRGLADGAYGIDYRDYYLN
ncbi:MAG: HD-GYP domain-containing protein [Herminiimonas sp.]|nr:HD-GYP domain-containing protein [Herminiimonas sp.]